MAESAIEVAAPEASASGARPGPVSEFRAPLPWAGVLPFSAYVALGLIAPMIAIAIGAFQDSSNRRRGRLSNIDTATHGVYLTRPEDSILLSVGTAILPAIFGLLIAYAIHTAKRGNVLRRVVITASGVFANFGGVPLAFLFIRRSARPAS